MDSKTQFLKEIFNQNNTLPTNVINIRLHFINHWCTLLPRLTYYLSTNSSNLIIGSLLRFFLLLDTLSTPLVVFKQAHPSTKYKRGGLFTNLRLTKYDKIRHRKRKNLENKLNYSIQTPSLWGRRVRTHPTRELGRVRFVCKYIKPQFRFNESVSFYRYNYSLFSGHWRLVGMPPFSFFKHRPQPEYLTRLTAVQTPLISRKLKRRKSRYFLLKQLLARILFLGRSPLPNFFNSTKVRVRTRLRRQPYGVNRIPEEVTLYLLSNKYLSSQNKAPQVVVPELYWRGVFLFNFMRNLSSRRLRPKKLTLGRRFKEKKLNERNLSHHHPSEQAWICAPNWGVSKARKRSQRCLGKGYNLLVEKPLLYSEVLWGRKTVLTNSLSALKSSILKFFLNKKILKALRRNKRKVKWRRKGLGALSFKVNPLTSNGGWLVGARFKSSFAPNPRADQLERGRVSTQLTQLLFKSYLKFLLRNRVATKARGLALSASRGTIRRQNLRLQKLPIILERPVLPYSLLRFKVESTHYRSNFVRAGLKLAHGRWRRFKRRKFRIKRALRQLPRLKRKKLISMGFRSLLLPTNKSRRFRLKGFVRRRTNFLTYKLSRRMTYLRFNLVKFLLGVQPRAKIPTHFKIQKLFTLGWLYTNYITITKANNKPLQPLSVYQFTNSKIVGTKNPTALKCLTSRILTLITRNIFTRGNTSTMSYSTPLQSRQHTLVLAPGLLFRGALLSSTKLATQSYQKPLRVRPTLKSGELEKFTLSLGGFTLTTPSKKFNSSVAATRYDVHKKNHSFPDANRYKKDLLKQYLSLNARTPFVGYRKVRSWSPSRLFAKIYTSTLSANYNFDNSSSLPWYNLRRAKRLIRPTRVRLRPGYIRIWKRARHSFRIIARLKYRYEHRLTRYFVKRAYHVQVAAKRYRSQWSPYLPDYTKSLYIVLVRCKFAVDFHLSFLLLESKSVYLNTNLADNRYMTLLSGDFVQLIVSIKFYTMFRFQQNRVITRKSRILKFAQIKFKPKTRRAERDVNHSYPDWVMNYKYNNTDVPTYIEVDFFSLSAYFIPEPLTIASEFRYYHEDTPLNPFSMYNWKYVC